MNLLIAAGVTRFGVLVIAIYLVQILIGLYRYSTQASALYAAQADALMLSGKDDDVGEMIGKLRLTFAFGRIEGSIPEKVADKLVDVIKAGMDKLSSARSEK